MQKKIRKKGSIRRWKKWDDSGNRRPMHEIVCEHYDAGHPTYAIAAVYDLEHQQVLESLRRNGRAIDAEYIRAVKSIRHPSVRLAMEVAMLIEQEKKRRKRRNVSKMVDLSPKTVLKIWKDWQSAKAQVSGKVTKESTNRYEYSPEVIDPCIAALERDIAVSQRQGVRYGSVRGKRFRELYMLFAGTTRRIAIMDKDFIFGFVCGHLRVSQDRVKSKQQTGPVRDARQVIALLAYKHAYTTFKEVGLLLGREGHGAGRYAVTEALNRHDVDASFRANLASIEKALVDAHNNSNGDKE